MAYDSSNEVREELLREAVDERGDYLVVSSIEKKVGGNVDRKIDLRMYFTEEKEKNVLPTKKGVRINSEMLLEVIKAMCNGLEADEKEDLAEFLSTDEEE